MITDLTMKDVEQSSLFNPSTAEAMAAELNAEDEDFTYVVRHDPAGKSFSFIEVYDEENELLGKF